MHLLGGTRMRTRQVLKWIAETRTPLVHDYASWERKNRWLRQAGLKIGKGVAIDRGFACLAGHEGNITIGDYAAIGNNVHFYNFGPIAIGKFCMIAADAALSNGGHDKNTLEPFSGPLTIGHGCWIGTAAKIVGANLTIGDNAIVGAGAVVIRDIPPGAIVAGVPARVIGQRELPDRVWHLGGVYFCPRSFAPAK
jgi:acetyltransferase-like isoleucine patch superfamily enzyme